VQAREAGDPSKARDGVPGTTFGPWTRAGAKLGAMRGGPQRITVDTDGLHSL
jgi:hypothetical protein